MRGLCKSAGYREGAEKHYTSAVYLPDHFTWMHSSTNTDFPKIERLYNSFKIYITQKCKSIVLLADITMHTKQRKEKYVVVSSIRSELPLLPQKGYFLFILFKLFP